MTERATLLIYGRGPEDDPSFATLDVGALVQHATTLGADRKCRPRPVPKLGPFEIDHKSAA